MRTPLPTRRTLLKAVAAFSIAAPAGTRFSGAALAQGVPPNPAASLTAPSAAVTSSVTLSAAEASRPELAGPGRLALFNESLPGPVIRVKQGMELSVSLANGLKENLSLVWQGVRLSAKIGGADATATMAAPGASRDIRFTPPDAGTFWYHASDPALARRALAGAFVVEEPGAPLYAADHVLFIQSFPPETGLPIFPVNGVISPSFQGPAGGRARLRLVNATTLFLRVRIKGPPTYVIAVDGQPTEPFEAKDGRIQLVPGGRVDVAATLDDADVSLVEIETARDPIRLAVLTPAGAGGAVVKGPPPPLPPNALPAEVPLANAARFDVPLGSDDKAPQLIGSVKIGRTVVLALTNTLDVPVSVSIQGNPVRMLDGLDDGWKPWWHDTVPVNPKATVRVAFIARGPGLWPIIAQRGGDGAVVTSRTYEVTPA